MTSVLRISIADSLHDAVTVYLEGRIVGPWVAEVRGACAPLLVRSQCLTLDLAGVSFADLAGIELLQELMQRHVVVINASPFLKQQLKDYSGSFLEGERRK